MPRVLALACILAITLLAAGCAVPITLDRDFVTLAGHDTGHDYRAVTGDDARVWVRLFHDENEADQKFWVEALQHEFVQQRGYDLVDTGVVRNADGDEGAWFHCAANVDGDRVGYLIAVWADDGDVRVVEFAARHDVFEARVEGVRAALRTVQE